MIKSTTQAADHLSGFRVSGQNLDIGEAIRERINVRVNEAVNKFYQGHITGHVTVHKDGAGFVTECVLHLSTGITLHARGEAGDAYQSADAAALNIEKRLRRYKHRLKDRHTSQRHHAQQRAEAATYVLAPVDDEDESAAPSAANDDHPVIVAETTTPVSTLSVGEAVMALDLSAAHFLVFKHAKSGRLNVVHRRADGNIGWIDPAATA